MSRHPEQLARTHRRPRCGFTLIEAIAAIVILSIAVPPMVWALRTAHERRADPIMTSRARWLAVEKLEDMIADRHSETIGFAALSGGTEGSVSGFANFSRTTTVSAEHGAWDNDASSWGAGTGYKTITVEVGWTDITGTARELSVSTVVSDYTP